MFESLSFKAMESSLSALWLKQNVIIHNIANLETPGFKAKQVSFNGLLEEAEGKQAGGRQGQGRYAFKATISTSTNTEVRPDGNNVDFDKENTELMNTYFQTLALYQKIGGQITNARYVIKQAFK